MSIRVKLPFMFQSAADGNKTVEVNGCKTIGDCLVQLRTSYPLLGKMLFDQGNDIAGFLQIFINGEGLNHGVDPFSYPIKDGDELYPIMMIEGG
jgi:molybdopterin converting factor small subunit